MSIDARNKVVELIEQKYKKLIEYNPLCKQLKLINVFDQNENKYTDEIHKFMSFIQFDKLLLSNIDYIYVKDKELIVRKINSNLNIHLFFNFIHDDYLQQINKLKLCYMYMNHFEKTYSDIFLNYDNLLVCKNL